MSLKVLQSNRVDNNRAYSLLAEHIIDCLQITFSTEATGLNSSSETSEDFELKKATSDPRDLQGGYIYLSVMKMVVIGTRVMILKLKILLSNIIMSYQHSVHGWMIKWGALNWAPHGTSPSHSGHPMLYYHRI